MNNVLKELDEIAMYPSTTAKRQLLEDISPLTKQVIQWTLDPYKMFGIKKFQKGFPPLATAQEDDGSELFRTLNALVKREVTGHKAREEVEFLIQKYLVPEELMERILNKDLRCGVGATLVNKVYPGLIPEFKVALAKEYEGEDCDFPKLQSIKYDGLRCLAFVSADDVSLKTRNGLEITSAEHLKPFLMRMHPGYDIVFDGELILKNAHFQDTSGSVRKKSQQEPDLEFFIFDLIDPHDFHNQESKSSQEDRIKDLEQIFKDYDSVSSPLRYVEHTKVESNSEAQELFKRALTDGFEGLVLKDPKAPYQFKRSSAWLKIKDRKTADVRVRSIEEGKGKYKGKVGALVFDFYDRENKAGTGLSDKQRTDWWTNPDLIVDKMIEVSYHEQTQDGNMRHSRFERIREDLE